MNIDDELDRIKRTGNKVNPELLTSLVMAVVARRHIAISTDDPEHTENEIRQILRLCFGWSNQIESVQMGPNTTTLAVSHNPMLVIVTGVESTSEEFQKRLHSKLHVHRVRINNEICLENTTPFSVVFLTSGIRPAVHRHLLDDVWLCTRHICAVNRDRMDRPDVKPIDLTKILATVRSKAAEVSVVREIRTYVYDIVVFVRTHRFVVGGLPSFVLKDLVQFARVYAAVNGYDYVIPEMVKLAAYKLLPMRIQMLQNAEDEPSVQYGSDVEIVGQVLAKVNAQIVVEDVLNRVEPPI